MLYKSVTSGDTVQQDVPETAMIKNVHRQIRVNPGYKSLRVADSAADFFAATYQHGRRLGGPADSHQIVWMKNFLVNVQEKMTRQEMDREDLMQEAVALLPRAEFQIEGLQDVLTVGFRGKNAVSIFFGQDPVYQFDSSGALRRAYVGGLLYRSQGNTLAKLDRVRTPSQTILQRQDLTAEGLVEFQQAMTTRLNTLQEALVPEKYVILRSLPDAVDWIELLTTALKTIRAAAPWLSPAIGTRR